MAVMLYIRFPLSLRNVEEILYERGIDISYETVRFWWNRFGPLFAAEIRKKRCNHPVQHLNWRWHIDEVFVKVNGERRYLWRAVDHEGTVLDSVVTVKRDRQAALKLLKTLLKRYGRPYSIVTDRLPTYRSALRYLHYSGSHVMGRWVNNRAENSHLVFRRKERAMSRFRSNKTLQKFTSIQGQIQNHFNGDRHLNSRQHYREFRSAALVEWRQLAA